MRLMFVLAACAGCGGGGSGEEPEPPPNSGFVQVSSLSHMPFGGPMVSEGSTFAAFQMITGVPVCTHENVGPCLVEDCFGQSQPVTNVSAGTITVTGAAGGAITLTTNSNQSYNPVSSSQPPFTGDETLVVAGTGADVPAFSVTLKTPTQPTITSPAPPPGPTKLVIGRAQGLRATWTNRSSTGKVYFYFTGPTISRVSMSCGFESKALAGEIPANALMRLPVGTGSLTMSSGTAGHDDVGDWRAEVETFFNALWPDGRYATTMIDIQ
jgi:hypothetical protein